MQLKNKMQGVFFAGTKDILPKKPLQRRLLVKHHEIWGISVKQINKVNILQTCCFHAVSVIL